MPHCAGIICAVTVTLKDTASFVLIQYAEHLSHIERIWYCSKANRAVVAE